MEHHKSSWLWRKKSDKVTITTTEEDKTDPDPSNPNQDEEIQALLSDKAQLENELKVLSDKLSSALSDCNLFEKHSKTVKEAMQGREKAEAKADSLKRELDEAVGERDMAHERLIYLDAALKECMQQLRFVREEQERRIHDAISKTSSEFEKSRNVLEQKLADKSKVVAKMSFENTNLSNALLVKEKLIDDLNKQKSRAEADYAALMTRLECLEKQNGSMKYEVRVLEKELEIRNEEKEFNRRTAEVSHKRHLESAKKIAKLELECQRLRVLVRKRLPGPAALAQMKSEVEMMGGDLVDTSRRRTASSLHGLILDSVPVDSCADISGKNINFLAERMCAIVEENRTLKEALNKKKNELHLSRSMYTHTASRLSQVESHLNELPKGKTMTMVEPSRSSLTSHELSLTSTSDIESDDKVSCAESWASVLISELEHFRHEKQKGSLSTKSVGALDLTLMDDFIEMERLAIVLSDKGSPPTSSNDTNVGSSESDLNGHPFDVTGTEIVPVSTTPNQETESPDMSLVTMNPDADGLITDKSDEQLKLALGKLMCKIIELVEGITVRQPDDATSNTTSSGYMAQVFQCKTSELTALLQKFIHACYELLDGKSNVAKFAEELSCALEWIMNHSFSLQDVSTMRDAIMEQFEFDESRNEIDPETGTIHQISGVDSSKWSHESSHLRKGTIALNAHQNCVEHTESEKLRDNSVTAESGKRDLEEKVEAANTQSELLRNQLQESQRTVESLRVELETLKASMEAMENQAENHRLANNDLDTQLSARATELNEAHQKLSSLEEELANETQHRKDLEDTCLALQVQLESTMQKRIHESELHHQQEKQVKAEWEITAASEKLAECQETILNLGKQLKALAPPKEAAMFDKVISTPTRKIAAESNITSTAPAEPRKEIANQRSSLLDRMLADNGINSGAPVSNEIIHTLENILILDGSKHRDNSVAFTSLAIVPWKKSGGGSLWKRLWRRKKSGSKKPPHLSFTT